MLSINNGIAGKLLYKAIEEDSDQYKDEIGNYNKQIEITLSGLQ
jgi:hypothetical protein